MEGVTLSIALALSVLIFLVSPVYGLIIYIASLVWYPSYLTISLGTIDFTMRRITILALLANLYLQTNLTEHFKYKWLDILVICYFVAQIVSGVFTTPIMKLLENRAGAVFDMVLPYFAVRMIVTNKQQYLMILKAILFISAPLAIVGFYQCLTGYNPVGFLMKYHGWSEVRSAGYVALFRKGFFRANVTFSVSGMFGFFFAMFGAVCAGFLRNVKKYKFVYFICIGLMAVGVFSSMSSGPMLVSLLAVLFMALYRYRRYWKIILVALVLICGMVEFISNRHFYDVLGDFTIKPQTAWFRSRLIEVALFEGGMSGHWLLGFGYGVEPGWSTKIDGREFTDIVNHYLLILCRFGLVALVPWLAMNVAAIKELINAYKTTNSDSDKWLIWCLGAGFFGLSCGLMSIALFEQSTTVFYMMIGFAGVMPAVVARTNANLCTTPTYPFQNTYSRGMYVMLNRNL